MYSMYPCLVLNFWFVYYISLSFRMVLSLSTHSCCKPLTSWHYSSPPHPHTHSHPFTHTQLHVYTHTCTQQKNFLTKTNFCNISRAHKHTPSISPIPSLQAALLNPRSTLETNAITQIFPLATYADLQGLLGSINLSLVIILYTQAKRVGR